MHFELPINYKRIGILITALGLVFCKTEVRLTRPPSPVHMLAPRCAAAPPCVLRTCSWYGSSSSEQQHHAVYTAGIRRESRGERAREQ